MFTLALLLLVETTAPLNPLLALERFPPPAVCEAWVAFQDQHIAWLETQLQVAPVHLRDGYADQLCEMRYRRLSWSLAANAGNCAANNNEWQAVAHLMDLRALLGPLAYLRGDLPPPVDLRFWQFGD